MPTIRPVPRPRRSPGRRVPVLASAMALVLTLAACGGSTGTSGSNAGPEGSAAASLPPCPVDALASATAPVEVVVWHTQQAKPLDTLQALTDQYNAKQNKVKVRLESQGTDYTEIQRKFNDNVRSRQLPGLLMVDDTFTQSMADSEVILPAQSCINASNEDTSNLLGVAKDYYTINGTLWPASANLGNILLFYNKDHFRRAGLDPEKPPTTLTELRQDAEKIKAAGVVGTPLVHEFSSWKTEFWLTGAHSTVVDNTNGRGGGSTDAGTLVDNAEAKELFDWFVGMKDAGLLQPIPNTPGQINQYLAMAQQQASMLIESSSAATSVEAFLGGNLDPASVGNGQLQSTNVSGLDIGAGAFPVLRNPGKTQMGGAAWFITNTTAPEVQAGAWDFMRFMNTPEAQAQMFIGGSFLPYNTKAADLPEMQRAFTDSLSGRWLKIAYDQTLAIDPSFPGPLIGPYDQFRLAMRDAQDQLMFNGRSTADALGQAQQQTDKALADYNREMGG